MAHWQGKNRLCQRLISGIKKHHLMIVFIVLLWHLGCLVEAPDTRVQDCCLGSKSCLPSSNVPEQHPGVQSDDEHVA